MTDQHEELLPPWSRSERVIPRTVLRPLQEFVTTSTASGVGLAAAAVVALVWANVGTSYERFWGTDLGVTAAGLHLEGDARFWVSEGLMSLFFLVAGLEIKRELLIGELRDPRRALLPIAGALAGMIVPAALFLLVIPEPGARAWGAAMPTDVALTVSVIALAGRRLPQALTTTFLALAIVDDIVTVLVLAVAYAEGVSAGGLAVAVAATGLIVAAERLHVRATVLYVVLSIGVWAGLSTAGIHPALAGVIVGLLAPVRPFQAPAAVSAEARRIADETHDDPPTPETDLLPWLRLAALSREAVSPLARIEHALVPWTNLLVLPLFALANTGIALHPGPVAAALSEPVTIGLVLTRLAGKVIGIVGVSAIMVRLGWVRLPEGVGWRQLAGGAAAAGMAFTVSLVVADRAFPDAPALLDAAKTGITLSVLVCGVVAVGLLRGSIQPRSRGVPR